MIIVSVEAHYIDTQFVLLLLKRFLKGVCYLLHVLSYIMICELEKF